MHNHYSFNRTRVKLTIDTSQSSQEVTDILANGNHNDVVNLFYAGLVTDALITTTTVTKLSVRPRKDNNTEELVIR